MGIQTLATCHRLHYHHHRSSLDGWWQRWCQRASLIHLPRCSFCLPISSAGAFPECCAERLCSSWIFQGHTSGFLWLGNSQICVLPSLLFLPLYFILFFFALRDSVTFLFFSPQRLNFSRFRGNHRQSFTQYTMFNLEPQH